MCVCVCVCVCVLGFFLLLFFCCCFFCFCFLLFFPQQIGFVVSLGDCLSRVGTIFMKHQSLLSGKSSNIISLSSAEIVQILINVKQEANEPRFARLINIAIAYLEMPYDFFQYIDTATRTQI